MGLAVGSFQNEIAIGRIQQYVTPIRRQVGGVGGAVVIETVAIVIGRGAVLAQAHAGQGAGAQVLQERLLEMIVVIVVGVVLDAVDQIARIGIEQHLLT